MTPSPSITAIIDDELVTRSEVQRWESRRATSVLKRFARRLGPRAIAELLPGTTLASLLAADLDTQRAALVTLKTGLGHSWNLCDAPTRVDCLRPHGTTGRGSESRPHRL